MPISTQFLIVAAFVLCVSMAVLGTWMNQQIKHSVLVTSGAQASEFMHGVIEPLVQDFEADGSLSAASKAALDALFIGTPLGTTIVSIKIWRDDGLVLYATSKTLVGQRFESTDVGKAAKGKIIAEYEDLVSSESAYEQTLPVHLIEVYAPLYRVGTEDILAVGEIYENADALAAELFQSQITTWLVVAATTLLMISMLYMIVRRGASTIAQQRAELRHRYVQAKRLAEQNAELRMLAEQSRLKASEANEQFLARIGSDIHDGPIQLLTLATLRLTAATRAAETSERREARPLEHIEYAVRTTQDALAELRNISTGLSLPEIDGLRFEDVVSLAIYRHEDLTGEKVSYGGTALPAGVDEALRICVYRVIQEGLTNATKYAPGSNKQVQVTAEDDHIVVKIVDQGPGMPTSDEGQTDRLHLGLSGMRSRVEFLNGTIRIDSVLGRGTSITARLPIEILPDAA